MKISDTAVSGLREAKGEEDISWKSTIATLFSSLKYFLRFYQMLASLLETFLPTLSVLGFIVGIYAASVSKRFSEAVDTGINGFIDLYGWVAPFAIFFILTPSLSRMIHARKGRGKQFATYAIIWLSVRRLLALVWAALFTIAVFDFPIIGDASTNVTQAITKSLISLGWMATHSSYFYAMYVALFTVWLSGRFHIIAKFLDRCVNSIEVVGQAFVPIIPIFMLAIGCYIYNLPEHLSQQIGGADMTFDLQPLKVFGFSIVSNTSVGMIMCYLIASLLIGISCFIWHCFLLLLVKARDKSFSVRGYFKNYWVRVYPLLWATSSEALAMPLNLYLVKKSFPHIKAEVRRFIIGVGSYMNINGTMICVFVLAGAVASILGIQISFLQFLLCIPLVFLIGFGVPGIPGELLLFGGPIVMLLNIPGDLGAAFLTLYLGLQIGLPDSFRTGNNSTDDCLCSLHLNRVYESKYVSKEDQEDE